jgi:hypothetical protein
MAYTPPEWTIRARATEDEQLSQGARESAIFYSGLELVVALR